MAVRACTGETVEVYEVTASTQIEVYEQALDLVREHETVDYFQIDTYPNYEVLGAYVGILRVHSS